MTFKYSIVFALIEEIYNQVYVIICIFFTSATYLWIFAYPLWKMWGKHDKEREKVIMKCTIWVAIHTTAIIISVVGFLLGLPGIAMLFLTYTAGQISTVKQFKDLASFRKLGYFCKTSIDDKATSMTNRDSDV